MASDEMIQAITKHAMGDRAKFSELKQRFESMDDWTPPSAAALGYLIAKDELEAAKEEEEPDVYDEVVEALNNFYPLFGVSPHATADKIFTLIHKWLDDEFAKRGFLALPQHARGILHDPQHARGILHDIFLPFIIKEAEE